MTLLELKNKVDILNISNESENSLRSLYVDIILLNKSQLEIGKTNLDKDIEPEYRSLSYARYKQDIGSLSHLGTPDLKLTGDFYNAIFFEIFGNEYTIISTDWKTESLVKKYGEEIFGLTDINKNKIALLLRNLLQTYITRITGLTFR